MIKNISLFFGNDEYLVATKAKDFVEKICPESEQSLALETVDGNVIKLDEVYDALDKCISGYRTVGLFGGTKAVWLKDAAFLKNPVVMKNEKTKALLEEVVEDFKSGKYSEHQLIISTTGIDRRTAFFKALKEIAAIHEFDLPERDYEVRPIAMQRVSSVIKEAGLVLESGAADLFVDKVGFETRQIIMEAEKLILFKGDDKDVSKKDIDEITSSTGEAIIWDFTDAIAEKKLDQALKIYRQLIFQKESAVRLIISIEGLFKDLLRFREYADRGWARLNGRRIEWSNDNEAGVYFSQLKDDPRKMHWFRASKILQQASKHSAKRLDACRRITLDTHEKMISSGTVPHELLLEVLLIRLCGRKDKIK